MATNASKDCPLSFSVRSGPTFSGNVFSVEFVNPTTYALPLSSTVPPNARSVPTPPMNPE